MLTVHSIFLHSTIDGTLGVVFNATAHIAALESIKITAVEVEMRFSSPPSIDLTSLSKAVPSAPIGI